MAIIKSSSDHLTINADGASKDIKFQANGVEKAVIDSSGNVLVGASPKIYANSTSAYYSNQQAGATLLSTFDSSEKIHLDASGYMKIETAGAERLRIDSDGKVGIGKPSALGAALHIDPATNVTTSFGSPLVKVGGDNSWASLGLFSIGLGYTNSAAGKAPAEIGLLTTSSAGVTKGALVFATRNVTTDTAPTERMRIDSEGCVTMPYQPAFSVGLSGNQNNIAIYGRRTIEFNTERYDQNSDFNTGTYKFTAPVTGKYQFNFALQFEQSDGQANWYGGHIETSNKMYYYYNLSKKNGDDSDGLAMSCLADMDAGDTAWVSVYQHGGSAQTDIAAASNFNGFLAC